MTSPRACPSTTTGSAIQVLLCPSFGSSVTVRASVADNNDKLLQQATDGPNRLAANLQASNSAQNVNFRILWVARNGVAHSCLIALVRPQLLGARWRPIRQRQERSLFERPHHGDGRVDMTRRGARLPRTVAQCVGHPV